jgi:hypothetical protein
MHTTWKPFSNKTKLTFLLSLTFLFFFSGSSIVLAGPSAEPYMPDKTFETEYSLGDLSIQTYRPKVENQYDIGCFKKNSLVPDLERICSVSNYGSKSEIEITKNGKTIIVGEKDKINEGEDKGTYKHDYIELYDKRKTIGFLVAVSKVSGSCTPHCNDGYLVNPETLEIFWIEYYLGIYDLRDTFVVLSGGDKFLDCEARYCDKYFYYENYFDKTSKKHLKTLKTISRSVQGLDQKQKSIEYFKMERNKIIEKHLNEGKNIPLEQPVINLNMKNPL